MSSTIIKKIVPVLGVSSYDLHRRRGLVWQIHRWLLIYRLYRQAKFLGRRRVQNSISGRSGAGRHDPRDALIVFNSNATWTDFYSGWKNTWKYYK